MVQLVFHLFMNDILGADDPFDDERVAFPRARDFLDDDVVPGVHGIPSRLGFDDSRRAFGQREDRLRPRKAQVFAEQQLANQRLDVTLVGALDALHGGNTSQFCTISFEN